ncbi:MAG: hypothetical protein RMJ67_05010, partial [Elusimicrobiota bacterium]|nr:hypothetical protein [Endomicrobiia bacterium]MDW8165848.1 hypothetical protein [Elusimicrobiota bacterium]
MSKIILIITSLVFLLFSCSPKKIPDIRKEIKSDYEEATPFVQLPEEITGEIITGIGFSEKRANLALAREAAITSAIADLAR